MKIKYRAKEKVSGCWVYGIPVGNYMITEDAEPNMIVENSDCPIAIRPTYSYWTFENNEIVEIEEDTISSNTGLKDKNGKEIYNGDIVEILFRDKKLIAKIEVSLVHGVDLVCEECDVIDKDKILERSFDRLRVIGNIYDNSELLKDKR